MIRPELIIGFCLCMIWIGNLASGATPSPVVGDQCGAEFQKVTTCLTFATGKAEAPSKECCDSVAEMKEKDPVCLCYIIQQIHSGSNSQIKSMGIQEARLLQLPSACKLTNASVAECPQLLHLAPNSPDAAIFTNTSSASVTPATSAPATTTPATKSNGFINTVPRVLSTGLVVAIIIITTMAIF